MYTSIRGCAVQVEEFDSVLTRDGRVGSVCEVLEPGVAYLVDFPKPMDSELGKKYNLVTFDTELVKHDDILEVTYRAKTARHED